MKLAGRLSADTPFPRAGTNGEGSGSAGCRSLAALCRYLRHRGRSPGPRRARRNSAGASASLPSAGEEPCSAAGRTMSRQLLSGTVLLGAALLLAGKGPPRPVDPSSPSSAPSSPRRVSSAAPDRPPRIPLVGWSRRAPASPQPLSVG